MLVTLHNTHIHVRAGVCIRINKLVLGFGLVGFLQYGIHNIALFGVTSYNENKLYLFVYNEHLFFINTFQ